MPRHPRQVISPMLAANSGQVRPRVNQHRTNKGPDPGRVMPAVFRFEQPRVCQQGMANGFFPPVADRPALGGPVLPAGI